MGKQVIYADEARARVVEGAKVLYDAVKVTMSPKGGNVAIDREYGSPSVTHDGVTVAKSIDLVDDEATLGRRAGAELIKEAASKMNDEVGDGTTTITVLTYHILNEANRLATAGYNPMMIRREIEAVAGEVQKSIDSHIVPLDTHDKLVNVATVSAGDKEIGTLIADVMKTVGKDGVVTVQAGQTMGIESEVVKGYTFDRGYVSAYMMTDESRGEAVYDNPAVVVTDKDAMSIQAIVPLLEKLNEAGRRDMLLIAPNIEGDLLPNLIINKVKGIFNTVAVKAPSYGNNQKEILKDIATLVGGKVITGDEDMTFANAGLDVVGSASKVIVTDKTTTIIGGAGDTTLKVKALTEQMDKEADEYEKDKLKNRIASLAGKVAVIKVGGATETEIDEKKYRIDDAVAATKAALKGGIVAGGGVTLVNVADSIKSDTNGANILKKALIQPFKIILDNAGLNPDEWLPIVRKNKGKGINVMGDETLVDMIDAGISDPAHVTKEAVKTAVSLAGTALTMGAIVVETPKKGQDNENN